jgi:glycosyltransferase involved in cell wall biosynthesis
MQRMALRRLFLGTRPDPERIFLHDLWFRGHNNPRFARLAPRLPRLDGYLITISDWRPLRAAQFRLLRSTQTARYRLIVTSANRRYTSMFTTGTDQIPWFRGRIVVDLDEPRFDAREVELLNQPNVVAVVLTTEAVKRRLAELGVTTPIHVIPQGVDLRSLSEADVDAVTRRHRDPGDLVIGYICAFFQARGDRNFAPIYDLDHVLELWDGIRPGVPNAKLWLIGRATRRAQRLLAGRDDVVLFDRIPFGEALPYVANFDIALYPRQAKGGHRGPVLAVKLIEYMGVGAPIVGYDLEITQIVKTAGAGILARDPQDFIAAVEQLAHDETQRQRLGAAGRAFVADYDWSLLVERYRTEVLDRYLCNTDSTTGDRRTSGRAP